MPVYWDRKLDVSAGLPTPPKSSVCQWLVECCYELSPPIEITLNYMGVTRCLSFGDTRSGGNNDGSGEVIVDTILSRWSRIFMIIMVSVMQTMLFKLSMVQSSYYVMSMLSTRFSRCAQLMLLAW